MSASGFYELTYVEVDGWWEGQITLPHMARLQIDYASPIQRQPSAAEAIDKQALDKARSLMRQYNGQVIKRGQDGRAILEEAIELLGMDPGLLNGDAPPFYTKAMSRVSEALAQAVSERRGGMAPPPTRSEPNEPSPAVLGVYLENPVETDGDQHGSVELPRRQAQALEHLCAHEAEYLRASLEQIVSYVTDHNIDHLEWARYSGVPALPEAACVQDLDGRICLKGVSVDHGTEVLGRPATTLTLLFGCDWDEEHGIGVVFCEGKPVGAGPRGELM